MNNEVEKIIKSVKNTPIEWDIPLQLKNSPAVEYRNMFARNLATKNVPEILKSYVYLSDYEMQSIFSLALEGIENNIIKGVGIVLGAGCGLLSTIAAQKQEVESIFALEICKEMVSLVIPKVTTELLSNKHKVIPVLGSFDDINLPNNSLDFAIEIDSLHHSDNLLKTLIECCRVLKPEGYLVILDRSHPKKVTDEEIDGMLSKVYSKEFLKKNCYPENIILTRRENGEHEYRLFEWESALNQSGFEILKIQSLTKPIKFKHVLKEIFLRKHIFGTFIFLSQRIRILLGRSGKDADLSPKESTVFIARKKPTIST